MQLPRYRSLRSRYPSLPGQEQRVEASEGRLLRLRCRGQGPGDGRGQEAAAATTGLHQARHRPPEFLQHRVRFYLLQKHLLMGLYGL